MTWAVLVAAAAVLESWALAWVLAWCLGREARERTRQLELHLAESRELRESAERLMEALTRAAGTPIIFKAPAPRASDGWLDGEAEVRVRT